MNETLTERQKLLLTLIIHEYVHTASPVGSSHLVERYNLEMSSATVRNELAELDTLGYLRQPHTSAGRVPTEEGYRYFVTRLIQDTTLPASTRSMISHQFYQTHNDVEQWMRLGASVLAHQSHAAALITSPHPEKARFKHVELISTRGRQVLMVLVMMGGDIHQQVHTLDGPFGQETLSEAAHRITARFSGKSPDIIQQTIQTLEGLESKITGWILEEMTRSDALISGDIFMDGLTNVLAEPEFAGSEDARRALHVLEERSVLQDLLLRSVPQGTIGGVQVLIGGEGSWDELRLCSMVVARYGSPGYATGMLGVLGPMRMSYGRSISVVRFLSGLLSDLVSETLVDDSPEKLN
jgi:heat-inducible transcriptional repressor